MIRIKKAALIFIIIASLVAGALAVCVVSDLGPFGALKNEKGYVRVTQEAYDDYVKYVQTYGKAELLRQFIIDNYYVDVDEDALQEGLYEGLFNSLGDPYSVYMDPEAYAEDMRSTMGVYGGIGITFAATIYDDLMIIKVNQDSPAEEAGLQVGDIIVQVDGVDYDADSINEAGNAMRGQEGTKVTVTVRRGEETLSFDMTRRKILSRTVEHEMLADGRIGYIGIEGFDMTTYNDFKAALLNVEAAKPQGLILDLRDNGGGLVDIALRCVDELMDSATVVYAEDNRGVRDYLKTTAGKTSLPYVVLVNENTASAAEIITSGIQTNSSGTVVGVQTYGKGIIQITEGLSDGSAVQITHQQYFSANGAQIHKVGITPDYIVELDDDCYDPQTGEIIRDLQLKKALELLGIPAEELSDENRDAGGEPLEDNAEAADGTKTGAAEGDN